MEPESSLIAQLTKTKQEHVDAAWEWYRKRAHRPRLLFRTSGVLVIVASLGLAYFASQPGEQLPRFVIPALALTTALLTSLNSFFDWQGTWQKYITTQLLIEGFMGEWEIAMAEAGLEPDCAARDKCAVDATRKAIAQTREVVVGEASRYFASVSWPAAQAKNGGA